ncbi:Alpha/Beta hydrolase protein [Cercophora newfieldiana]|uniref:Alpha/Beta hydrolase protein n=1 Tax=Cercophora newfieldiana TaxID=92897 RepID=A0AA40CUR3_9PEZI|nr:Alpha/Beta hydrolase protein [Cercophora newfieldiana]
MAPGSEKRLHQLLGFGIWTADKTKQASVPALQLSAEGSASAPSTSLKHSAGTSNALVKASKFLDTLPVSGVVTMTQRRSLDRYLAFIERRGIHRVEDHEATAFEGTEETWDLIRLAAARAKSVYQDTPLSSQDTILRPSNDSKKVSISLDERPNNNSVLVVAIRGTTSYYDWLVNLNGDPAPPTVATSSADSSQTYHSGFLSVATRMQDAVASAVSEKLSTMVNCPRNVNLLLTGHSAGGAVAKLLYAMASWPDSPFARVISKFSHVHCITFGSPPVAAPPLPHPQFTPFQSGLFLNIVNEGDPIALAYQDYIQFLLQCFVNAQRPDMDRSEMGELPLPVLRLSGTCIVLRDVSDTLEHVDWRAATVQPEILERKLFGNPVAHHMATYVKAIEASHLASAEISEQLGAKN